ncbi:MAG: aconitase X catalytic domain-containing protein [Candidatus Micrarchaeota archaeon]
MELSKEEQAMFDGERGEAARESMEILVALGRIYCAERMVPVSSAQVSGVSFKTIGQAGLEYLQGLAIKGARTRIPTFLNPAGMDAEQWKEMGVPEDFAMKQIAILDAYSGMGIMKTCTCTPYFIGIRPGRGEHVAWAESSAVAFANSVLGACTNREGGPSALAAAICGVTPYYGLHAPENRVARLVVDVSGCELRTTADFGALGYAIGSMAKDRYPAFTGMNRASEEQLKVLGASMAATGSVPLFFAKGITPEWSVAEDAEAVPFGAKELAAEKGRMDCAAKPDLVTIGCPHASLNEIREVARMVSERKPTCGFWVCTARKTKDEAVRLGYARDIEAAGGKVVADTCMVVCPLEQMGYRVTGTNSGKAAKYLPNLCRQRVAFGDIGDILYR